MALSLIRRGRFKPEQRVFFADEQTAVKAGYRPCGACMRAEHKAWKDALGALGAGGPGT